MGAGGGRLWAWVPARDWKFCRGGGEERGRGGRRGREGRAAGTEPAAASVGAQGAGAHCTAEWSAAAPTNHANGWEPHALRRFLVDMLKKTKRNIKLILIIHFP